MSFTANIAEAATLAQQESPSAGSYESGIGLIRGWVCDATTVEIEIDGSQRLQAAYGTTRDDTAGVCGDTNNGYGAVYNWNRLGTGWHSLRALADGVEFSSVNFYVTTLGQEYLQGKTAQYSLQDFPETGNTVTLRWSEADQNFVIVGYDQPGSTGCANIAGSWYDSSGTTTMSCTVPGGSSTAGGTVTIEQDGCSIQYQVPETNITRFGRVEGNNLNISGAYAVALKSGVSFSQNSVSLTGTINGNQISISGSGSAAGTNDGANFSCASDSSGVLSR